MNTEFFIAKRIIKGEKGVSRFSKPIIRISILAIALGISVMILSVSIVQGFQQEIRNKVIGFGSHIVVQNFDSGNSFENLPISKEQDFYHTIHKIKGVRHIQVFATKAGIIKTNNEMHGVILKGIDKDFDWNFFKNKMIEGRNFTVTDTGKCNEMVVSKVIAKKLHLKVGDELAMYFIQQPPRVRKFAICGIYETGLAQADELYVLADIHHVQKLNDWSEEQISGFEILLDKYDDLDKMDEIIYNYIPYNLNSVTIAEKNQDVFNWLELQDLNVIVIIVLMVLVAGINIISALLILILERTNMIGILKALGTSNKSIRKIFMYNAAYLIGLGLMWGNVFGIGLSLLQKYFKLITLPQESYYLSHVPIEMSVWTIMALNLGTFVVCLLMLILPSYVVTKISPVKAIRFD
ncbi:MAG: ABC transporter permease [Bacteroidetes bacterium]|nr:ABC transporter permease [Bacteroidota bacterium]MBV6460246.1 Lipoprotein-releasing system transmembrane protein LolC [Flavobacteriales bacterium]WKZ74614.1 MAG: ABC transporter permease [Vicingaceae bacterium]MCL4816842.1 ABC transporter permease [Flavobacteriales bacterium]NOG94921.1 ABC transporter permease [Bacteroidota bacterium]